MPASEPDGRPTRRGGARRPSVGARGAERYAHIKEDEETFVLDDAPLLGTPEEIIAQLKRLEAGGVENVLFAAPGASVAGLRTFAEEIMPAFDREPMALAQV